MTGPLAGEFKILRVYKDGGDTFFELPSNSSTRSKGTSSLFWDSRRGHALVQRIESTDLATSLFRLQSLYSKTLPKAGEIVWLSGWLGNKPEHFNLEKDIAEVRLPNGTLGWLYPKDSQRWVIHVHGRRAQMGETLRNFEQFAKLGFSQLTISMATDAKPYGLGKLKSTLGETEWREVEQAVEFAVAAGAKKIVLFGWSQGAMITGTYLKRAKDTSVISGVVFDSPLLDYRATMQLHAKKQGFDEQAGDSVIEAIANSKALRLLGYSNINCDELSLVRKALPVAKPMLVFFSSSDGYVAIDEVYKLPQLNQEVTLVEFSEAGHCRLFNQDTEKYQQAISMWLRELQI